MRHFLREPAMTLTREFTQSWADSNSCKHEPAPEPIPAPSPKICSSTQKSQCANYCDSAYTNYCSRCRRLGRRFQDKILKSCTEDMEAMDGCDGSANGKAVHELQKECKLSQYNMCLHVWACVCVCVCVCVREGNVWVYSFFVYVLQKKKTKNKNRRVCG